MKALLRKVMAMACIVLQSFCKRSKPTMMHKLGWIEKANMKKNERELIEYLEAMAFTDAEGFPHLAAIPRKDGLGSKVWCRYCKDWHCHGVGYSHRVAHCHDIDRRGRRIVSPYRKAGYYLERADKPVAVVVRLEDVAQGRITP